MFPAFDIFSGHSNRRDAMWIEAREGLEAAYEKMLQVAAEKPAPYFLFNNDTQTCVASVDTSAFPVQGNSKRKGAAT